MPSHILHDVFAAEAVSAHIPEFPVSGELLGAMTLGAQGPDLFFHNRRRKPSGVFVGARMHRHGYGRVVAEMCGHAEKNPSPRWAYVLGFTTHAILDRRLHPFINYFAGWHAPGDDGTMELRYMHPFFERILDVLFSQRMRGVHPMEIDFATAVELPAATRDSVLDLLTRGIEGAYEIGDPSLAARVDNAYRDSLSYYRHSNRIGLADLAATRQARDGDIRHWIALVHPPVLPDGIDYANERHAEWCLPCDSGDVRSDSAWDLYDAALEDSRDALRAVYRALVEGGNSGQAAADAVAEAVGVSDLSSTREQRCVRRYSRPLPLNRVVDAVLDAAEGV